MHESVSENLNNYLALKLFHYYTFLKGRLGRGLLSTLSKKVKQVTE